MRLAPLLVLYIAVCVIAQPETGPVRDEPALLAAAERLAEHSQLAGTGPDPDQRAFLWHGPGLVVLLAPLVALDAPLGLLRLTSPLVLFAAVVVFHRVLRTRLAPRPALLGTYALALYAPFAIVLGTIQKEPLAVLLVVMAMLGCAHGLAGRRPTALAGAGIAFGALAMVRLEYGWVILALLGAALAACAVSGGGPLARRTLAVTAVAGLACVPWLSYTERLTGQPLYWGSSSGLSLFWMSPTLPGETGQWHSPVRVHRDPALAPYRPLFRRLDEVHPLQSDRELRRRALANVRARPLAYIRNLTANAARLVVFAPTRPEQPPAEVAMYAFGNGTVLAGVAWACVALWRRRRSLPAEAVPFATFAALAVAVHLPPSASPRMLIPVVPVLIWFVAQAAAGAPSRPPAGPSPAWARPSSVAAREPSPAGRRAPSFPGGAGELTVQGEPSRSPAALRAPQPTASEKRPASSASRWRLRSSPPP
jgi:hypothetical protein